MPIRMTDDEPGNASGGGGGGRRGGGGGILSLISLVAFFIRHPILSLVLAAIGGVAYLLSDGSSASGDDGELATFSAGATLDPKVYDEALVHEPISAGARPAERVSLAAFAPTRRSQGRQGSCVGWATSYAARTILLARQTGQRADDIAFSPSYTFNPIAKPGCNGTYLVRALERLRDVGDLPFGEFDYDQKSCTRRPASDDDARAAAYRIKGFTRLSLDAEDYRTNAQAVKDHLAQGAPVVIGMRVGGTFETLTGKSVWHPTQDDYDEVGEWGGHAMAVLGYDDGREGGAFQLMNSWGDDWGEGGLAWVRYADFDRFVREAYGLYPMGEAARAKDAPQRIRFGLVEVDAKGESSGRRIAFQKASGLAFRTVAPIAKGTRFKVEFSNTRPVYTYLFGQETDGSSYVLFPYTDKHSPYCGTTGTRVFPRKQSLTADATGTRDAVAVVISPKPLDPKALNARISSQPGVDYAERLSAALGDQLSRRAKARVVKDVVELTSSGADDDRVDALVLEFDKQ